MTMAKDKTYKTSAPNFSELYAQPDGIYTLAHSVGPMCLKAKEDLENHYLKTWRSDGGNAWPTWLEQIERFKRALGKLLNADADDFCPQDSVSLAFSQWLAAVSKNRVSKKRKVVVMHEDAFASLGFAVKGLCDVYNLELRFVSAPANNREAWEDALSEQDVFACLITHAHSNTGILSDVEAIARIAKSHNVLSAVDIAQSVGIIPIDLALWQADCVVGSCVKWLSGGPGAAFLYVPYEQANQLNPEHLAWFSHAHPFEFDIKHFEPAKGVMRFWGGTPSIAPFTIAATAIEEHNKFGTAAFRLNNLSLMQHFAMGYKHELPEHYHSLLQAQKIMDENHNANASYADWIAATHSLEHSATLCLPLPQSMAVKIKAQLTKEQVQYDERNNVIRLSFGAVNSIEDVKRVLACFD